ncbi:MAG: response regulator [Acidimicrobiia bacterium]|nr:response regulator [Acidimicrobiia bacterium]
MGEVSGRALSDSTEVREPDGPRARKPVILTVDDDPQVLAAVARDLRRQYGARFRIVRAPDGETALGALEELALSAEPVALIVADQRMPGLSGVELLAKAKALHPDTRTVLLTAYADTDAAITAINDVRLDHYILKPWDPPEERLFPFIDELLDEWEADFHPPFEGIRLVGHRWSPDAHRLRDFLSRNLVPFRWIDVERDAEEAQRLRDAAQTSELPLVVLADGSHEVAPSNRSVAQAVGLHATTETESFDLVVIGAGPAGLAAAVYGASEGLRTAVLEREAPGGQAGSSSRIENYLGFPNGLSGADLARRALDQAKRLGAEVLSATSAAKLGRSGPYRLIELDGGGVLAASAVIVATGVAYRTLDIEGAQALRDAGVFYGAASHEARAYEGEQVVIIGAANSAGQAALHFARFAATVTMLVRAASLTARMSTYLVDQIEATPNIVVRLQTQAVAVHGAASLDEVEVVDGHGAHERLPASGLFIFIGAEPCTGWLDEAVARDAGGFVLAGPDLVRGRSWKERREPFSLETSLPGVFAAGDVRAHSLKRVASAVGDGSIAVHYVHQYLGL